MKQIYTDLSNDFSKEIWEKTYKYRDETSIHDTWARNANAIASVEKTEHKRNFWQTAFNGILANFYFCPAGRILANAGTDYKGVTLFNCYVGAKPKFDLDSLDGILETLRIQAQTLKSEGGWGMNFSFIRPRGSLIGGIGVESPGAVKYMEIFNKSSDIITSGSGTSGEGKQEGQKRRIRKGAQMGVLSIWHPDIEEFITAKRVLNRLDKFNVSVGMYNVFMEKVKKVEETGIDEEWELIYPITTHPQYKEEWDGNVYTWMDKGYPVKFWKTVSVKYLWNLILKSTYDYNDPGIIFLDRANKTHLANYLPNKAIDASNPCGEQTMPTASVCDLGSLLLPSFYDLELKQIDEDALRYATLVAVRYLDNVNDYSSTPHEAYAESATKMRRIGLGIMGWASLLYLMKVRYGSPQAEKIKDDLMRIITTEAVETSIGLALEKGAFEGCDNEKVANHVFWKRIGLPKDLIEKIREYGIRNSALFSIQPTGTTSALSNLMSGGCEPNPWVSYIRTMIVQNVPEHIKDVCPDFHKGEFYETDMFKLCKEGSEDILKGEDEFGVTYKIDKNRGLTKEILCEDYAVTILKDRQEWGDDDGWLVTIDDLSVHDHIQDLKGWAKWVDAAISKTVNLPNDYSFEEFKNIYLEAYDSGVIKGLTTYRAGTMATVLSDANKKERIVKTNAPTRPAILPCKIFYPRRRNGVKFIVVVGLFNEDPYEIFAWDAFNGDVPDHITDGFIKRIGNGHYELIKDGQTVIDNIGILSDPDQAAINRLISGSLRHGMSLEYVVSQLSKVRGNMYDLAAVLSRVLKNLIPKDTLTGEKCPECNAGVVYSESCQKCSNCIWSKC